MTTNTVKHTPDATDSIADDLLRNGYERWLRLEEEKAAIGDDLKELFAELKGQGFTPKALRESFRRVRNADNADQQEHDAIVDLYVASLTRARPARTREASYSEAKGRGDAVGKTDAIPFDPETGEITDNQEQIGGNGPDLPVEAVTEKQAAGTSRPTISHSPAELLPSEAITAGEAAQAPQAQASPTAHSDDDIPAFIKQDKPDCLKLKDGHCRISFATSALCAECNQHRAISRASA